MKATMLLIETGISICFVLSSFGYFASVVPVMIKMNVSCTKLVTLPGFLATASTEIWSKFFINLVASPTDATVHDCFGVLFTCDEMRTLNYDVQIGVKDVMQHTTPTLKV